MGNKKVSAKDIKNNELIFSSSKQIAEEIFAERLSTKKATETIVMDSDMLDEFLETLRSRDKKKDLTDEQIEAGTATLEFLAAFMRHMNAELKVYTGSTKYKVKEGSVLLPSKMFVDGVEEIVYRKVEGKERDNHLAIVTLLLSEHTSVMFSIMNECVEKYDMQPGDLLDPRTMIMFTMCTRHEEGSDKYKEFRMCYAKPLNK